MGTVLTSLPVGERVGIAFSGGLDTSAAVAWMREKGAIPYAYTADLGQYDEPDLAGVPDRAREYGAELARLVDCRDASSSHEGLVALQCGAFHIAHRRQDLLQHHAARPGGHRHPPRAGHAGRRRRHLGRRLDLQGQRHRALLPLRPARQPQPAHLQAVARRGLRRRARRPGRDERVAERARAARTATAKEKAYSTDANIWGATHEAKLLEQLDEGMDLVEPIMGVRALGRGGGHRARDRDRRLPRRAGRCRSTATSRPTRSSSSRQANAIGGRHGLGMSDQIENRIIEAKSRGIYEAPGMALLHLAYERLVSAIHNEGTIENYRTMGRRLGRLLYEGRWFDPQALMLREPLLRWVGSAVTGEVTLRLRRGDDYTIVDTTGPNLTYQPERLSMEKTEGAFGPLDRIGQLTMRNLDIADTRQKLDVYRSVGTPRPRRRRRAGERRGLRARRRRASAASRRRRRVGRRTPGRSAGDAGGARRARRRSAPAGPRTGPGPPPPGVVRRLTATPGPPGPPRRAQVGVGGDQVGAASPSPSSDRRTSAPTTAWASRNGMPRSTSHSARSVAASVRRVGRRLHPFGHERGRGDHARQRAEGQADLVDGVEQRLLVLLQVAVVGERQALQRRPAGR